MTAEDFRRMALSFPEAEESSHMDHPDFRVCGKIFATLSHPDDGLGMVKLTPEQQHEFIHDQPKVFAPVKGGWGLRGATHVKLRAATKAILHPALLAAWCNRAPNRLAAKFEGRV